MKILIDEEFEGFSYNFILILAHVGQIFETHVLFQDCLAPWPLRFTWPLKKEKDYFELA